MKLACSRSHGCVARAGSSCRRVCANKLNGGKGEGLVLPPFFLREEVCAVIDYNPASLAMPG